MLNSVKIFLYIINSIIFAIYINIIKMKIEDAVKTLTGELMTDPNYRISWQANIAMAFYDCANQYRKKKGKKYLSMVDIHTIANDAANNFLNRLSE
jgi:hypothetical protein